MGAGTYAATREVIEYEELEPQALKGKAGATAAWRAVAVKTRRGGRRAPLGIEAPLVGRASEIALLKETVRRTASERRPHLVTVVGAAGVGKSRLTWELEKYLDGLPEPFVWRKGRCLAYAQASFGALADLIRADAQIFEVERGQGYWTLDEADRAAASAIAGLADLETRAAEDLELEADIRAGWAKVLQGQGRADEAMGELREHIDRLEGSGPTRGRALLLARLGWVIWRSEHAADSLPILERALEESRAVGARDVEAWAVHELGVALTQTGRAADGVILIRKSLELAEELGDSTLWLRSHTNLASVSMGLGAPPSEVEDLLREALPVAQRNADRWIEGWLLFQLADLNEFRARMSEARVYTLEALEIARLVGDRVQVAARRAALAYIEASMGNWDAVERLEAEAPLTDEMDEEQNRVWTQIWTAWRMWPADPDAAVTYLARELPNAEIDRQAGCHWLARMALRTGDKAALAVARASMPAPVENEGPLIGMLRQEVEVLAGDDPHKAEKLAALARDLEASDYLMLAEHAWVDVALVLGREGRDASEAIARVEAIEGVGGMKPVLGSLPETRWMARAPAAIADA